MDFRSPPLRPPLAAVGGAIYCFVFLDYFFYKESIIKVQDKTLNNIQFYLLKLSSSHTSSRHNHYIRAFKMRVFMYICLLALGTVSNEDKHVYPPQHQNTKEKEKKRKKNNRPYLNTQGKKKK